MFTLTIRTENDAFGEDAETRAYEVARILREIARKLEAGDDDFGHYRTLRDSNGNDVGRARLRSEDEER